MYVAIWRKRELQPRLYAMIRWDLERIDALMRKQGIPNRRQLGELAGLSLPTTYNISNSGSLTRVDVPTLEALASALGVKDEPLTLLCYEP